jgi:hypothetical protein
MKKIILYLFLLFSSFIIAQPPNLRLKNITFNQKIKKVKGKQLVLKRVISDSRCPEGVNCIWAGECEIEVAIYKNRKLISTENILLSPKLHSENITWFKEFYANQNIFEILLLPYPKNEVSINPKDYYVKIIYK